MDGVRVKVIAGELEGVRGAVGNIVIDPSYYDITIASGSSFEVPCKPGHTAFAYVFEGAGSFGLGEGRNVSAWQLALFGERDHVPVSARDETVRFIFVAGRPLREPIAWGGPIVMNTEEKLNQAFREYRAGTFIKE